MDNNILRYRITNFINNRPLCLISSLIGMKDFLLGLGFILVLPEIRQTLLFQHFDELLPHVAGPLVGLMFLVAGAVTGITAVMDKTHVTQKALRASALLWLFSGIMYAINGNFVLAIALGFFMSTISGYLAFYYKHAPLWRRQKEELREFFALDVKPDGVVDYESQRTRELTNVQVQGNYPARDGFYGD